MKTKDIHGEKPEVCASIFKMFGDRWSLRIVDALRHGELRYKEIQTILDINTATLSLRLRSLIKAKVLVRKEETIDKLSVTYALTSLGKEILPIYDSMITFGSKVVK